MPAIAQRRPGRFDRVAAITETIKPAAQQAKLRHDDPPPSMIRPAVSGSLESSIIFFCCSSNVEFGSNCSNTNWEEGQRQSRWACVRQFLTAWCQTNAKLKEPRTVKLAGFPKTRFGRYRWMAKSFSIALNKPSADIA